jgi:gas vesicle protein
MGQNPEELTTDTMTTGIGSASADVPGSSTSPADIEATRASLSRDIDELTDKVSPARVVERRKEAAKSRFSGIRDKVMGAAPDLGAVTSHVPGMGSGGSGPGVGERASGVASSVGDSVSGTASGAVDTLSSKAQGNPLAAGLVAFGAGMLVSALIPVSEKEAQVAHQAVDAAKEHGQPLVDEAKSIGQQMGSDLAETATESAQQVKETAQESVQHVKEEGQSSAQSVKDEATPS